LAHAETVWLNGDVIAGKELTVMESGALLQLVVVELLLFDKRR